MFYKHWKKIFLAIAAFFWNGCSDNVSSSDVRGTCTFSGGACPEYGVDMYVCENPEDSQSPDSTKCTYVKRFPCSDFYKCDDGLSCDKIEGETIFTCYDKQENVTKYTEDEFKAMYDVKEPE